MLADLLKLQEKRITFGKDLHQVACRTQGKQVRPLAGFCSIGKMMFHVSFLICVGNQVCIFERQSYDLQETAQGD
jgi:hypothetical protein